MKRYGIAGLALAIALAGTAHAQDEAAKPAADDQTVTLSPVALPIIVDRRLVNYVFVTIKIWVAPNADLYALRDKEPYFRDALVRSAHRTPFLLPHDYNHVDEAKLDAALMRDATAIAGPGAIQRIQIFSQTPQHRLPSPH